MRFPVFALLALAGTATTESYTLSLHDALPISRGQQWGREPNQHEHGEERELAALGERVGRVRSDHDKPREGEGVRRDHRRSEEHTSELQSRRDLVCRLLLEKKKRSSQTTSAEH